MNPLNKIITLSCLLIFGATLFNGCSKEESNDPPTPAIPERGEIAKITPLASFTLDEINQILESGNIISPQELLYPVQFYAVSYSSIDASGQRKDVSGAFAVPLGSSEWPLLSLQHGTETKREYVASASPLSSTEGIISLITASAGYFTVVPDYAGFGQSLDIHPYLHAASLVPQVIDFIRAGRNFCTEENISLNGKVFLTGYSEGGFISLAVQKTIEENYAPEFDLTAVAPLAGPYDLKGMCDKIFESGTYSNPAYIAYLLTSWDHIYGWDRLNDFFIDEYAPLLPGLFDGSKDWGTVTAALPLSFAELVNPSFSQAYLAGVESELRDALLENTLLDWAPEAPLHFFHGDADKIVPIENMFTAVNRLTANGGSNIKTTTIEGGTHDSAGPVAIFGTMEWFATFNAKTKG